MKLTTVKIENFRSYKNAVTINFEDLTAFVGKNDIGKSTVLEALDIFFNDGNCVIQLDKDDINKQSLSEENKEIIISACFTNLPSSVIIDSTNETTLESEYLLNANTQLEIIKKYSSPSTAAKVFIKAYHPTNPCCNELLKKTNLELKSIITKNNIVCEDKSKNAVMRNSIWNHFRSELLLSEVEVDVTTKGEAKSIWEQLQK